MIPYKITTETIANAESYIPLAKKLEFIYYASERSFTSLRVTSAPETSQEKVMPSMYKVNSALKNRYLMGAFVRLYLKEEYIPVEGDEWLMSQDDYDNFKGGHIFNEMNRFKSNNEIRDKVFDILSDYKELTTMFEEEQNGSLNAMNDTVSRLYMAFTEMMTPNQVNEMLEDINASKDEIEQYIAERQQESEEETEEAETEE